MQLVSQAATAEWCPYNKIYCAPSSDYNIVKGMGEKGVDENPRALDC